MLTNDRLKQIRMQRGYYMLAPGLPMPDRKEYIEDVSDLLEHIDGLNAGLDRYEEEIRRLRTHVEAQHQYPPVYGSQSPPEPRP